MPQTPSRLSPDTTRQWVTPEDLNVQPALLGRALARPRRRLLAMAIDLVMLGVVTSLLNAWLLLAVALVLGESAWAQQQAPARRRRGLAWSVAALLLLVGLQAPPPWHDRPVRHAAVHADVEDVVAEALEAAAAASAAGPPAVAAQAALAARVVQLEAELAQLRRAGPAVPATLWAQLRQWRGWLDDLGLGLGWAVAYFSLLPAWWQGQTLGKRLLGLRVVELTGKPMTAMLALRRYGGYAAALATGGVGLLQLLWDPNRQALQDKTAHTVVLDLRRPPRPVPPPSVAPDAVPSAAPDATPDAVSAPPGPNPPT
jgi:uncharacterized RDD family membrane protein YckC